MRPYTFYPGILRRLAVVAFQQSAEPLATKNPALRGWIVGWRHNPPVTQPLMRAFYMIMFHKLRNNVAKMLFAEEYHFVRTFVFNGLDEAFAVGICLRRALHPMGMVRCDKFGFCMRSIRSAG